MASSIGKNIRISIFGESHGPAVGVVLEGIRAGTKIDLNELNRLMMERMGVDIPGTTARKEAEHLEFLSGVIMGSDSSSCITSGTPISVIIRNEKFNSDDYTKNEGIIRPGHADFTQLVKWGEYADIVGGGHLSGRLTAPLAVAGGVCLQILAREGIELSAGLRSIGRHELSCKASEAFGSEDFCSEISNLIEDAKKEGDSLGGIVLVRAKGLPAGIGEPIFDKVESRLGQMIFSIPAVKGLEFGSGFDGARMKGSENNDEFCLADDEFCMTDESSTDRQPANLNDDERGNAEFCCRNYKTKILNGVKMMSNNCGGLLGGITTGSELYFQVAVKPTPSISKSQKTVNLKTKQNVLLSTKGRHDISVAIRTVPVIRAATALVLYDLFIDYKENHNG